MTSFDAMFERATGFSPLPYQVELAESPTGYDLVDIPTGLGKTAACVLAWVWQRRFAAGSVRNQTPRRLVYCLPTRVLVGQTQDAITGWLSALDLTDERGIAVHTLLGGDVDDDWLAAPERDAILIGTQDLLISRALNRGYAMSRFLWPMAYGLLNNDVRWIYDEIQLMGAALPTSAQLDGLAGEFGTFGRRESLWVSATLAEEGLATPDAARSSSASGSEGWRRLRLSSLDVQHAVALKRTTARKELRLWTQADSGAPQAADPPALARAVLAAHVTDTLTLVVVNRVERAQDLYRALLAAGRRAESTALVHGRFRPADRMLQEERAGIGAKRPAKDRIVVATQAIEAGVDISARTLWTELAPWPSVVQRLGRLNRYGDDSTASPPPTAYVIDLPSEADAARPYEVDALEAARNALASLPAVDADVRDASLEAIRSVHVVPVEQQFEILRSRDVLALFDTTADLAGDDIDVSRFVRDTDDTDVRLCWREFRDGSGNRSMRPDAEAHSPFRDELVAVPIYAIRGWKGARKGGAAVPAELWSAGGFRRKDQGAWISIKPREAVPGRTYVVDVDFGGYDPSLGWIGQQAAGQPVEPVASGVGEGADGDGISLDDDPRSRLGRWVPLREHATDVAEDAAAIAASLAHALGGSERQEAIVQAARWHDLGKAHPAFQYMLGESPDPDRPWAKSAGLRSGRTYAVPKAQPDADGGRPPVVEPRPGFRHELASALAWLAHAPTNAQAELVAYLVAAHHGKVRASIRSLPGEHHPRQQRHARGVWDGDELPEVDLGDGVIVPATKLELGVMELGDLDGRPSWQAMVLGLLDQHGPFRLALLETIVRAADWRASRRERQAGVAP